MWTGRDEDHGAATCTFCDRQAMNYLLGQLEELGYIERRVDPDDVRSRRVYLTERGASTISVIRNAVTELERDWESEWPRLTGHSSNGCWSSSTRR